MTYTIEKLKAWWLPAIPGYALHESDTARIVPELIGEIEGLTIQLRAQEVTTINERLRTARECAEMADRYAKAFRESRDRLQENGNPGTHSEASMKVSESLAASIRREFKVPA